MDKNKSLSLNTLQKRLNKLKIEADKLLLLVNQWEKPQKKKVKTPLTKTKKKASLKK